MPSLMMIGSPNVPIPPIRGGAVELWMDRIAQELQEYQVNIISPRDPDLPKEERKRHIRYLRLNENGIFQRVVDKLKLDPLRYARNACEQLEYIDPDIIQVFNRPSYLPFIRYFFPKTRLILHMMNTYEQLGKRAQPDLSKRLPCDLFIGCSKFIVDKESGRLAKDAVRSIVISNAVDLEQYKIRKDSPHREELRQTWGAKDRKVLFFAGRLNPKKGIVTILNAMPQIIAKQPDVLLVIAGSAGFGKDQGRRGKFMKDLDERMKNLGQHVHFAGFVPGEEMHRCYEASDLFLAPSVWEEPFAFVVLEAAAAGLPVITSRRGGTGEFIEDGKNGLLLKNPEDPEELSRRILWALENREAVDAMGLEARRRVEETQGWPFIAGQLRRIFKEILLKAPCPE